MNDYAFGNFLCMLREKNGMTQAELASKLGVTPAAVSKWENGSSKPRVEVLFQLAQLLGVRAEELMCGHYIPLETVDPEIIRQINERYEYLKKVDAYNTASVKLRRVLSWLIDWVIIWFSVCCFVAFVASVLTHYAEIYTQSVMFFVLLVSLTPLICFVLRDLIFGGRSLGKRIFGLIVLDKQTEAPAKLAKCAIRNIFYFLLPIDIIVLLISGTTIGDRVAHTVVVKKDALLHSDSGHSIEEINKYDPPKKANTKRTVCIVVVSLILGIALLFSTVMIVLSTTKNTEEYKLAYTYLIKSQAFERLNVDESAIRYNRYSLIHRSQAGTEIIETAEIGFSVKGESFTVVCHKLKNDVWIVCDDCTVFD